MAAVIVGLAAPAGADDLEDLALGQSWRGWADARLIVPTVGLPYELNPTPTPFARAYIDAVPGRSSAFASLYYGDEVPEEGILEIGPAGGFHNPTLHRCNNPDSGRGTSGTVEFGSGGAGAKAVTDCTSRLKGAGEATSGPLVSEGLSIRNGFSQAASAVSPGRIVSGATARLEGVDAGDLHIGVISSWVQVDYVIGAEPKVSYKLSALGVGSGDEPAVTAGAPAGFTVSGTAVPASEVVQQFTTEINKAGATTAPESATWEFDVLAPRIYLPGDTPGRAFGDFGIVTPDEIAVFAPVVRLRHNNYACCKNATLENSGFYLGLARVRDYIADTENSVDVLNGVYEAEDQSPPAALPAASPVVAPAVGQTDAPSPPASVPSTAEADRPEASASGPLEPIRLTAPPPSRDRPGTAGWLALAVGLSALTGRRLTRGARRGR